MESVCDNLCHTSACLTRPMYGNSEHKKSYDGPVVSYNEPCSEAVSDGCPMRWVDVNLVYLNVKRTLISSDDAWSEPEHEFQKNNLWL